MRVGDNFVGGLVPFAGLQLGKPQQFLRSQYGIVQPRLILSFLVRIIQLPLRLFRTQELGTFDTIQVALNLFGSEEPSDFGNEGRQLGDEIRIALRGHHEVEDFLSYQVVRGALQSKAFTDAFRRTDSSPRMSRDFGRRESRSV